MCLSAGIDFGTEKTVISLPTDRGICIARNSESARTTPSVVTFGDYRRYSGAVAEREQMRYTSGAVTQLKRLIGRPFSSADRKPELVALEDGCTGVRVTFCDKELTLRPEQIVAYFLKSLDSFAPGVGGYVMTVSPSFSDRQRRILKAALQTVDKNCIRLLNSTTAAAVAFAMMNRNKLPADVPLPALFLDFGASSLSVAVANLRRDNVQMLSATVDPKLGGAEFTNLLVDHLLSKVKETYHTDPATSTRAMMRFRRAAEKLKKTLSINTVVPFEVQSLPGDVDVSFLVRREDFLSQIGNLIEQIAQPIEECLKSANVRPEDLAVIEILGGGSRIPAIRERISQVVGREPTQTMNADECVAIGAGYIAASSIAVDDVLVTPVTARWSGGEQILFGAFCPLPSSKEMSIKTAGNVDVGLFSGDAEVGKLHIETECEEEVEILVRFGLDASSIVEVESVDAGDNKHEVKFRTEFLGGGDCEEMRGLEAWMAEADAAEQLLDKTKNCLDAALFAVRAQLRDRPEYLSPTENKSTEKLLLDTQDWRDDNEFERLPISAYEAKLSELRAVISLIEERDRRHCNAAQTAQALTEQLTAVDKALCDDQIHANDDEWNEIRQQLANLKEALDSVAAWPRYDDSPFELDAIANSINDAAAKQTALMAKPRPIRPRNNASCWDPIWRRGDEPDEDEAGPWCPWERRQSSRRGAGLPRRSEMKQREKEPRQRRSAKWADPWGMPTRQPVARDDWRRRQLPADPWSNAWF
jgi:molecular chaperone DnaK (HSP70)